MTVVLGELQKVETQQVQLRWVENELCDRYQFLEGPQERIALFVKEKKAPYFNPTALVVRTNGVPL